MSCNCNSGDTPEYYITLDGVGADGYSPEINIVQEDTASFKLDLINKNNEQLTPAIPKLTYLDGNFVTNSVFSATLANYSTTAQIAATYLSKADAATTYLKVDGSNANNPITINNLSIQSIGTGTRIGSSGGALTLQGSGVRPAYLQTGSTSKSLALYTDLPTRTSQLTNDSGFLTASDITNKMETNGSNAAGTVNLNNVQLSGNISSTETEFLIQNNNGDLSIRSIGSIYLDTGSNGDVYYDGNEVATVDQIPTVSNATITLTQGGVVKGSFTLNQSGAATIALDSGGSTIGNQISLITEDTTRSLTIGVNNTTKQAFTKFIINEGGIAVVPIKLITTATAPISLVDGNDGLSTVGLDYDTNSLDVDTNNKLAVDSDYIEAHKAYLADGDTLTDPQGLADVVNYTHSTFDLSKFTVVGTPTITDDGIASGFSDSDYITQNLSISNATDFELISPVFYDILSSNRETVITTPWTGTVTHLSLWSYANDTNAYMVVNQVNNGTRRELVRKAFAMTSGVGYQVKWVLKNGLWDIYYRTTENAEWTKLTTTSVTATDTVTINDLYIGKDIYNTSAYCRGSIDLKQFSITVDGQEVFSGNKTGVDTYTIGSDTITIPYKVSKTGSKVVDSSRRPEVEAVYEDQGYALYYTLDEANGNFTLPMGEIYGYITRLEGIVKDLQTRLTALESNINGGGAGVVQQGLLGMSPLSLGRPQLLGAFNPEDEMNTMYIEPIEDEIAQEEIEEEPQETEERGGQDE